MWRLEKDTSQAFKRVTKLSALDVERSVTTKCMEMTMSDFYPCNIPNAVYLMMCSAADQRHFLIGKTVCTIQRQMIPAQQRRGHIHHDQLHAPYIHLHTNGSRTLNPTWMVFHSLRSYCRRWTCVHVRTCRSHIRKISEKYDKEITFGTGHNYKAHVNERDAITSDVTIT